MLMQTAKGLTFAATWARYKDPLKQPMLPGVLDRHRIDGCLAVERQENSRHGPSLGRDAVGPDPSVKERGATNRRIALRRSPNRVLGKDHDAEQTVTHW